MDSQVFRGSQLSGSGGAGSSDGRSEAREARRLDGVGAWVVLGVKFDSFWS